MEIIKETQYLSFQLVPTKGTTKRVAVVNRHHQETIGEIKWFGSWRQYCFFPYAETIWNTTCMEDVQGVIKDLMNERK
jgi:hypothetical protein